MVRFAWIALLAAGICTGALRTACADEDRSAARDDSEPRLQTDAPPLPPAYEGVLPATTYIGNLLLPGALDVPAVTLPASQLDVDFLDNSTLGRLKRIRSLSLLTLSDQGSSRLFLGVNEDGLLGLHFRASSGVASETPLEVARMPYVNGDDEE